MCVCVCVCVCVCFMGLAKSKSSKLITAMSRTVCPHVLLDLLGVRASCVFSLPSPAPAPDTPPHHVHPFPGMFTDKAIAVLKTGPFEVEMGVLAAKWAPTVGLPAPVPAPTLVRLLIHVDAAFYVYSSVPSSGESFGRTDQNSLGVIMAPRRLLTAAQRTPVGLRKLVVDAMMGKGKDGEPEAAGGGEGGSGSVGEPVQDRVHLFGCLVVEPRPEGSSPLVSPMDAHSYDFSLTLPLEVLQGMLVGAGDGEMLVQTFSTMPWHGMGDPVPLKDVRVLG